MQTVLVRIELAVRNIGPTFAEQQGNAVIIRTMPRNLLWIAAVGCVFAGMASAESFKNRIELTFEPDSRSLRLVVPQTSKDELSVQSPPEWLKRQPAPKESRQHVTTAVFSGMVPEINEAGVSAGSGAAGAYLIDFLGWVPVSDDNTTTELVIRTPPTYRGLATGELISESVDDERYTAVFRIAGDLENAHVFFGPYEVEERKFELAAEDVTVRTYFKAGEQEYAQDYLDAAGSYVSRYSEEIGPYPFDSFSVVSAPIPVGYAFNSVTYISEQILGHSYMLGRSLAHEVLHSWWGSGVRIDYESGNWAEALTTYQADYALTEDRGTDAAKEMRRQWLTALTSISPKDDRPLREFRSSTHDRTQAIGYSKGAMLFHMLRTGLGEAVYQASLRRFWLESEGHTAGWSDIQSAFEIESGEDLNDFFDQWLERSGMPELSVDNVSVAEVGNDYAVSLQISQIGEAYIVDVPLEIETKTKRYHKRIRLNEERNEVEFLISDPPLSISIDPDFETLRVLADGELPLTLGDVIRADKTALIVGARAVAVADETAALLFGEDESLPKLVTSDALPVSGALFAIGATDEVIGLRNDNLSADPPDVSVQGSARAWVEQDAQDRIWLFVSADDPSRIPEELSTLRFYAGQSFVKHTPGGQAVSGRWPVRDSALTIQLHNH